MTSQLEQYLLEASIINASSTRSNLTKKHSSSFQYVIEIIFHLSKRLVSIWSKIVLVTIYFVHLFLCRTSFNWFPKPALHDVLLVLSIFYVCFVIISNGIPPTLYLLHSLHYCLKWYLFTALCSALLLTISLIRLDKTLLNCLCQFPLWISIVKRLQQHSSAKGLSPSLLTLQQMMVEQKDEKQANNPLFYQSCQELKYDMFSCLQRVVKVCLFDYEMQQQPDSSDEAVITIQHLQTLYHRIVHEYLPQRLFSLYLPFYANDDASSFFTSFLSLATAVIAAFTVTWEIGTHMQGILTKYSSISSYHSESTAVSADLGYDDTSSSSHFPLLHRLQQMRKKQERLLRSLQRCEEFLYSSLQQFPSSSSMQSDDRRGSSTSERLVFLLLDDSSSNDPSTSLNGLTAGELQALLFSKYSTDNEISQLLSSLLSLQRQQSHREQAGVATVDDQHPARRPGNVCLSDLIDVNDMENEEDDDEHGTGRPQSNTGRSRWDDDQCKEEEVLQGTVFKDISLSRNRDSEYDQQSSLAAQAEGRQRQQTLMIEMKVKLYLQHRLVEQRPQRVIDFDKVMLNGESYSNTRTVSTAVIKEQAEAALPANEEVAISVFPLAVRHDILSALGKNPVFQISCNRKDGTLGDDDSENDE